jgi:hypothetical protein
VYEHTILSIDVVIVLYMFFIFLSLPFNLILANLCLSNLIRQVWNMGEGKRKGRLKERGGKQGKIRRKESGKGDMEDGK